MSRLIPQPLLFLQDRDGKPVSGAKCTTYVSQTSTPVVTYQDFLLQNPHANPITATNEGYFPAIYSGANFELKIVLSDPSGLTPSLTIDPASPFVITQAEIGGILNPETEAENSTGVTIIDSSRGPENLLRYVVLNDASSATANTANLQALFDPTKTGPTGTFYLPPLTGTDTCYINDWIPCRDGVHLNLMGCTLNLTKSLSSPYDVLAGVLMGIRDFSVENGTIVLNYSGSGTNISAIQIGARASECGAGKYFPNTYDSALSSPQGNCYLRNLKIISTGNPNGLLIQLTGGLRNVLIENIDADGGSVGDGIDYEFGWATSGTGDQRQTSHAHNLTFRNIDIRYLNTTTSAGLTIAGAYNYNVENLYVRSAAAVLVVTTGESLFYRPWVGSDEIGVKRNVRLHNITGRTISGTAITLSGAQLASGGYLAAVVAALGHPSDYQVQTDLGDFVLDGFAIDGTANGFGILCSAGCADIRNGHINGFEHGIFGTDEWVRINIEHLKIFNCAQIGIDLNGGSAIWSPAREKTGFIRNCNISGNSTSVAGSFAGIVLDKCANFRIEGCRIGKEAAFDGAAEGTQGNGIQLGTGAKNVVCRGNHVGGVFAGSYAYYNASSTAANGCTVENASGVITTNNSAWLHQLKSPSPSRGDTSQTLTVGSDYEIQRWAGTLTANRTVTLSTTNAVAGSKFRIVRTGLGSFTLDVGGLKTIPSATAAFVDVSFDGSTWFLTGYGTL